MLHESLAASPSFDAARAYITEKYPLLKGSLISREVPEHAELIEIAEQVLAFFSRKVGGDEAAFESGLEAFSLVSYDFLRLQSKFLETGRYQSSDAKQVAQEVYLNQEKMEGYYLDGVLLTYAFWPNHARFVQFYRDSFLPLVSSGAKFMEVGVGHGLMALHAMLAADPRSYEAYDISPYSLKYARELIESNGPSTGRMKFEELDAGNEEALQPVASASARDALLCCEVLEHVEQPAVLLKGLRDSLRSGGYAFITTCTNADNEDHVYLFEDPDAVRSMVTDTGFRVVEERLFPVRGFESERAIPMNYAAILQKP